MDPLSTIKEGAGLLDGVRKLWLGWRYRPKLTIGTEVGRADFRGPKSSTPAEFVWLNVKNGELSPHATARGVIGHVWIDDQNGSELHQVRGRWRRGVDELDIGPGTEAQLDAMWKLPDDVDAYVLSAAVIEAAPMTWQVERYRLPPSTYRLRVQVQALNSRSVEGEFWVTNPGAGGPLFVDRRPGPGPFETPPIDASTVDAVAAERLDRCLEIFEARIEYVIVWHRRGRWQPLKVRRLALQERYPDALPEHVLAHTREWADYLATERRIRTEMRTPIAARLAQVEKAADGVRSAIAAMHPRR